MDEWNENQVLFGVARFGWLSMTQLAKLADVSQDSMRHIVRRMLNRYRLDMSANESELCFDSGEAHLIS